MFEDKTIECRVCGQEFIFSAGEQEFYQQKGLLNEPGRCPNCRQQRRLTMGGPMESVRHARCISSPVPNVARKIECHSCRATTNQSTAASVLNVYALHKADVHICSNSVCF